LFYETCRLARVAGANAAGATVNVAMAVTATTAITVSATMALLILLVVLLVFSVFLSRVVKVVVNAMVITASTHCLYIRDEKRLVFFASSPNKAKLQRIRKVQLKIDKYVILSCTL